MAACLVFVTIPITLDSRLTNTLNELILQYDPGTQQFDTSSKQRAPAYTDRILYKYKSMPMGIRRGSNLANLLHPSQVECLAYDSVPSIVTSDHKPVWALFRNPIRPGVDT